MQQPADASQITLLLNGQRHTFAVGATIHDALLALGISPTRKGIAVARGDEIVRRAAWQDTTLRADDRIEVVTAMQGG